MKGQRNEKLWGAKNNNNIPQIIAIRMEFDFSEDPRVIWKTVGNFLCNLHWACERKSQMHLIQTRIKSQSASVKHASIQPPAGKTGPVGIRLVNAVGSTLHYESGLSESLAGLTGEVGAGAVGAQVAAVSVGSVALVHALVGGLQLGDVQQDRVPA